MAPIILKPPRRLHVANGRLQQEVAVWLAPMPNRVKRGWEGWVLWAGFSASLTPTPTQTFSKNPPFLSLPRHHYQIIFIQFTHACSSVFFYCTWIFFLTSLLLFGLCSMYWFPPWAANCEHCPHPLYQQFTSPRTHPIVHEVCPRCGSFSFRAKDHSSWTEGTDQTVDHTLSMCKDGR